jgi:general secretion pathway protein G
MNLRSIRWGIAIPAGWFVILVAAAILLTSADSERFELTIAALLVLIIIWLLLTAVALGTYFYRAWRRLPTVPNKAAYSLWLCFKTACTLAVAATLLLFVFYPKCDTSPRRARERTLLQDLSVMRSIIKQYTLDKQKRPQSLNDLVEAGYIRRTPIDPMTRRSDTWILEWSNDPTMPGIINVRSASTDTSSIGGAYHDW